VRKERGGSGARDHGEAPSETLSCPTGTTDNEDRIVAGDRTEDVGPVLGVERNRHGLSAARHGTKDGKLADSVDSAE
jgi:hypothetical protein